ncbi:hypothetical protein U3516DRAFT_85000 [Neocallimastix sp. 'constans']
MIESGADINLISNDDSIYLEIIKLLIYSGSNINHKDYYEQTILMIVGGNINYNIKIKILIENGADGNIEDNKNWPILMDASHYSINLEKIKTIK